MPTVGEQLRVAREARKLSIQEVAEATNLRTDHVTALEEGNYKPFPAPVYVRGSIRTYAKLLKLDVSEVMTALSTELSQQANAHAMAEKAGHRRGILDFIALQLSRFGWKRGLILLIGLLILLIIKVASSPATPEPDPLSDLPPPTYEPGKSANGGYLPLPTQSR